MGIQRPDPIGFVLVRDVNAIASIVYRDEHRSDWQLEEMVLDLAVALHEAWRA